MTMMPILSCYPTPIIEFDSGNIRTYINQIANIIKYEYVNKHYPIMIFAPLEMVATIRQQLAQQLTTFHKYNVEHGYNGVIIGDLIQVNYNSGKHLTTRGFTNKVLACANIYFYTNLYRLSEIVYIKLIYAPCNTSHGFLYLTVFVIYDNI